MIRSTFAGFTTAQMAMSASQRALDVTGQNLSNVNTPGYTRQRLDLTSISPVGSGYASSRFDCKVGQGVMMTGITQIRDPFLDKQYRNQVVKVGTADAMDQVLSGIGDIFDEIDKKAISKDFNDLISQLSKLASTNSSDDASSDAMVRSACEVLMNAIHQNSSDLKKVEQDIIDKLQDQVVPKLNQCVKRLTELNESIKSSQILGNPALELQDERNSVLDSLAEYLPIKVTYKNQNIGGTATVETMSVTFTDTDGRTFKLVDDDKGCQFDLATTGGGVPLSLKIIDTDGNDSGDISNKLANGVLKGNFDMLNKSEMFDDPASDVKGVGFYSKMFDTFVNEFATLMNDLNAIKNPDGTTTSADLFSKIDATKPFSAENIKVSDAWMNGSVSITRSQGDGSTAYDNVQLMINKLSDNKNMEFNYNGKKVFTGTFLECYNNIQNTQSIERSASTSILKNHVTVLNQIANSKDSVSGVYMDEEVMSLMRYQQSYNAAARLMTTMDEALNTLITNTGVVGR